MGFQGSVTDEQIKDYLHKNVGDFRPDWQSLYFDLMGMGELGALAEIAKPAAVKSISTAYKAMRGSVKPEYLEAADTMFRHLSKGIRRAPQELLDPVENITLKRKLPGAFGNYDPTTRSIRISADQLAQRTVVDPSKGYNTLFHELSHSEQWGRGLEKFYNDQIREIHAQYFSDTLEGVMKSKGGQLSMEDVNKVFKETLVDAKEIYDQGASVWDVAQEVQTRRGSGTPLGGLESNTSLQTSKLVNQDLKELVGNLGGEMFESTYKPGDMIDVPGVGKVRYDANKSWVEGGDPLHQYTIQEGPARGATIGSYKEGLEELTRKALETVKKFSEKFKFESTDF